MSEDQIKVAVIALMLTLCIFGAVFFVFALNQQWEMNHRQKYNVAFSWASHPDEESGYASIEITLPIGKSVYDADVQEKLNQFITEKRGYSDVVSIILRASKLETVSVTP